MIVASCPSCRENVTVPIDARPSSIVRCPLCNAQCRLEEFLAQLPPPLIVLADADAGADEATARSASAEHDTATEHDMALDIGRPLELDEQLPAFDFTPASPAEAAAEPCEIVPPSRPSTDERHLGGCQDCGGRPAGRSGGPDHFVVVRSLQLETRSAGDWPAGESGRALGRAGQIPRPVRRGELGAGEHREW